MYNWSKRKKNWNRKLFLNGWEIFNIMERKLLCMIKLRLKEI